MIHKGWVMGCGNIVEGLVEVSSVHVGDGLLQVLIVGVGGVAGECLCFNHIDGWKDGRWMFGRAGRGTAG